ncbi:MAG: polysaccharide biosynthesis protein [Bacteroidales bacterium]|nr:polysaccharide biosynthesis protein [Bacteroidales bacterium]
MSEAPDNRRIARNAFALTIRMVLSTVVGLYTSRVVLETLGVDDYGIYSLVGGIIAMAGFLNMSMAGATSRFLTFEMGRDNQERLANTFSTSLNIHLIIAAVTIVLAETVGLWFVNTQLVIPPERMYAANWVYQFSVFSIAVSFTQVPYNAVIIAHERMNVYAYIELLNVGLKLLLIYLLIVLPGDKLILYAAMVFAVSLAVAMIYRIYCLRHFPEARYHARFKKEYVRPMLTFSGYDIYGNMCVTFKDQGINIVVNWFYGLAANVGATIGLTVTGTLEGLTTSVSQAYRPQIIKQYAAGNIALMQTLIVRAIKFTTLFMAAFAIPVFIRMDDVLYLWLGQIPDYAMLLTRFALVTAVLSVVQFSVSAAIHATGNIKAISFISGTMFLLTPVIGYAVSRLTGSIAAMYSVSLLLYTVIIVTNVIIAARQIPELDILKLAMEIIRIWGFITLICIATGFIAATIPQTATDSELFNMLCDTAITAVISLVLLCSLSLPLIFNKTERQAIFSAAKQRFSFLRRR